MKKNNSNINWRDIDDVIFIPKKNEHSIRNISLILVVALLFVALVFIGPNITRSLNSIPDGALKLTVSQFDCNHPTETRESIQRRISTGDGQWMRYTSVPFRMQGNVVNSSNIDIKDVKIKIKYFGIIDNSQTWSEYKTIPNISANSTQEFSFVLKQSCSQGDIQWEFSIVDPEKT